MRIQIDGTNTNNKGAELMLYAILEQIESKYPEALVYYNPNNYNAHTPIKTKLRFEQKLGTKHYKKVNSILKKLRISTRYFSARYASKNIDLILDGGGFQFSDQFPYPEHVLADWETYYKKLKANGAKIILLSQAFGPFTTESSQRTISLIKKYVDILVAREKTSHNHLLTAGIDPDKLWLFSDFTVAVSGTVPEHCRNLKGKVCIIPNKKMISHGSTSTAAYLEFYKNILTHLKSRNEEVFLLNHEGNGDLELCKIINEALPSPLPIVTGLNAKEVKGVIGSSKLVISSRYHGVASALNQAVPCLATSWSHKYALLYEDFGIQDKILDIKLPIEKVHAKLDEVLDKANCTTYKETVAKNKKQLLDSTQQMWHQIWQFSFPDPLHHIPVVMR